MNEQKVSDNGIAWSAIKWPPHDIRSWSSVRLYLPFPVPFYVRKLQLVFAIAQRGAVQSSRR